MKRYGDLWPQIVSWPNLLLAARKARRGKRRRGVVERFHFDLERQLLRLQEELQAGAYQPGPFTTHRILRPKSRLISAAPYRDRVVHHAVMNVLAPLLDRHFHADSYACRPGKGTHAAARRLQHFLRRYRYVLQCDVRKFFPSIDHAILKELFRQRLKDGRLLALLDRIVDGSNEQDPVCAWFPGDDLWTPCERRRGLPIGNLTSQWFANWYLDPLDHQVTSQWGIGGYVRYCDDFLLLDDDRQRLADLQGRLHARCGRLRLQLHAARMQVTPARFGRRFVGFVIAPSRRRLTNAGVRRFLRRLRWLRGALGRRVLDRREFRQRIQSWVGHAGQGDCRRLICQVTTGWRLRSA